ncbi:hypothetical protein [Pseudoalteromonas sp.]|uniref:hypothetical protein n=1 Tax=Pseudoalteromonas sp. TaxID=53249 RepID=UPI0035644077
MSRVNSHTHSFYKQQGFVLTIELILITTILIIGSIGGIVALRNALIKHQFQQQQQDIVIADSNDRLLGKMLSFDEHEAPLVAYVDRTVAAAPGEQVAANYRVLIGIRDDRFTTREPIYYDAPNCTGNPCIKSTSDENSDSIGLSGIRATGVVSYFNALQGGPNYAIGRSVDGIKGDLFRSTAMQCPATINEIQSRYVSQKVVTGSPCEEFSAATTEADSSCLTGVKFRGGGIGNSIPDVQPCEQCPTGLESQGDIFDNYVPEAEILLEDALASLRMVGVIPKVDVTLGEICCPTGTRLQDDDNVVNSIVFIAVKNVLNLLGIDITTNSLVVDTLNVLGIQEGVLNCVAEVNLQQAQSVPDNNDPTLNALESFTAPFKVKLNHSPAVASEQWYYIPPDGEGNNSGI